MKKLIFVFLIIIIALVVWLIVDRWFGVVTAKKPVIYGVSFQPDYADYLTGDYQSVFRTILDEWNFRYIRLSARWSEIEPRSGDFNFNTLDWLMDEAHKRGAKIILAVGQKTPRWPECHAPEWTRGLTDEQYFASLQQYIIQVVEHYKNHPALEIWQVENEPFLSFGISCRSLDSQKLKTEINWVKTIDVTHPVLIADSGELSTWFRTARAGDYFGTTLYQKVWNKYLGYWSYSWLPSSFYRLKLWLNHRAAEQSFVVELQAEPWLPDQAIENVSLVEQKQSMDLGQLQKNLAYARRLGFSRNYLWGAEWWYWLKTKGENEISDFIANLPK